MRGATLALGGAPPPAWRDYKAALTGTFLAEARHRQFYEDAKAA